MVATLQRDNHVIEGESAPITCVVHNLVNGTVIWKKHEVGKLGPKILTAGETRVTQDERVEIIHDAGTYLTIVVVKLADECDGV